MSLSVHEAVADGVDHVLQSYVSDLDGTDAEELIRVVLDQVVEFVGLEHRPHWAANLSAVHTYVSADDIERLEFLMSMCNKNPTFSQPYTDISFMMADMLDDVFDFWWEKYVLRKS